MLAGLTAGVKCWALAALPGPGGLMCLQASPGAPARPPGLPATVVLRTQPAAQRGPARVRKEPGLSALGSPWHLWAWGFGSERRWRGHLWAPQGWADTSWVCLCGLGQDPAPPGPSFSICQTSARLIPSFPTSALQQNGKWRRGREFFLQPKTHSPNAGPRADAVLVTFSGVFSEIMAIVLGTHCAFTTLPGRANRRQP